MQLYDRTGRPITNARDIRYNPLASGLVAKNVQTALDEIVAGGGGGSVLSVNGQTGDVVLDTDDVDEGLANLYFTEERAQDATAALLASLTILTEGDETATLPGSIQLLEGTNISFDTSTPNQLVINATGGGGGGSGQVDSVLPGNGILVDATDPENPEVSVNPALVPFLNVGNTFQLDTDTTVTHQFTNAHAGTAASARIQVQGGDAALALWAAGTNYASPIVINGPVGKQGVIRTLGGTPLVFGTNNIARMILGESGGADVLGTLMARGIATIDPGASTAAYIAFENNGTRTGYIGKASGANHNITMMALPAASLQFGVDSVIKMALATDNLNLVSGVRLNLRGLDAISALDTTWLRLNQSYEFTAGVYTPGLFRAGGGVHVNSGGASAPAIANAGDTNTGIFWSAADTLNLAAGGASRLSVGTTMVYTPVLLRADGGLAVGSYGISAPTNYGSIAVTGTLGSYCGVRLQGGSNKATFMEHVTGNGLGVYRVGVSAWSWYDDGVSFTVTYPIRASSNVPYTRIVSGGADGGGRITVSTSAPSGTPTNGDIWLQREA